MRQIITIAKLTVFQLIQEKVIAIFILLFGFFLFFISFLQYFNPQEQLKFVKDLGISGFSFFAFTLVVFGTATVIQGGLGKKLDILFITKPITRWQYLLGKMSGLAVVIGGSLVLMYALLIGVIAFYFHTLEASLLGVLYLLLLKYLLFLVVTSFLFVCFDLMLGAFLSVFIFFLAHSMPFFSNISTDFSSPYMEFVSQCLTLLLPRFDLFQFTDVLVLGMSIPAYYLLKATVYFFIYCAVVVTLSLVTFNQREF